MLYNTFRSDHEYEETGSEEDVEEGNQNQEGARDEANDNLVGNEKKQNGEYIVSASSA